jgi:hypothetical protein
MKKYLSTIVLACILLTGLLTFNQYGESWDDRSLQKYAAKSINAYVTFPQRGEVNIEPEDLGYYGPSYVMAVALLSDALHAILPFSLPDLRHLIYFLTYFAGVLAFHSLAKRWLSDLPALGATVLYAAQPLLWGHAFINPKDTPFLSLFLISLALGFDFFDKLPVEPSPRPSRIQLLLTALWVGSVFSLFIFTGSFHNLISGLVLSAHDGKTNIVSLLATDILTATPEIYIQKYFVHFLRARAIFFILFTCVLVYLFRKDLHPSRAAFILLPSVLLGFTTSTRILGPFAGLIVSLYAFRKHGRRAFMPLVAYALVAVAVTYITWPYLWSNPIGHFIESLQTMSKYPWYGKVLFNGVEYSATNLPYTYLPVLLAVQFTEPTWVLFIIGAGSAIIKYREKRELLALTGIWFLLPLIGFIVMGVALYDNFRQIFFILPPIFLMAGLGLESALGWVNQPTVKAGIVGLVILPGIIAGVRLHPYEYVYYNALVENPNRRFELDYWAVSYREAAEYVNAVAPANTNIMVVGPGQVVDLYIREDLTVLSDDEEITEPFDYVISTTRYNFDVELYPDAEIVYKIERNGMILTVVKKIER